MSNVRKACVIGNPISHSLSPLIHQTWLNQTGIDGVYEKQLVSKGQLSKTLKRLFADDDLYGVNITLPFKEQAMSFADEITKTAAQIGAANLLYKVKGKIIADNTDAYGFIAPLLVSRSPDQSRNINALVYGAGGAARAVIIALQKAGIKQIFICNRSNERAQSLTEEFNNRTKEANLSVLSWKNRNNPQQAIELVINASSAGMTNTEPLDVNLQFCQPNTLVYDLVYRPLLTPFIMQAKKNNLEYIGGLEMLLSQANPCFKAFFGIDPPVAKLAREKLKTALNKQESCKE